MILFIQHLCVNNVEGEKMSNKDVQILLQIMQDVLKDDIPDDKYKIDSIQQLIDILQEKGEE